MNFQKVREDFLDFPGHGNLLVWDASTNTWTAQSYTLNKIHNCYIDSITNGELFTFDNSQQKWINLKASEIADISDNLGNHIAAQDLNMNGSKIIGLDNSGAFDPNDLITFNILTHHTHSISDVSGLTNILNNIRNSLDNQLLGDHADTNFVALSADCIMSYDGTNFVILDRQSFTTMDMDKANSDLNFQHAYKFQNLANAVNLNDAINMSQLNDLNQNLTNLINSNQALNDHIDVSISSPAAYHVLIYNAGLSRWENQLLNLNIANDDLGDHTAVQHLDMSNFNILHLGFDEATAVAADAINKLYMDNKATILSNLIANQLLNTHNDVDTTSVVDGDFLMYNNSTQTWGASAYSFAAGNDDLGNHIATRDLDMNNSYKIIGLTDGISNNDLITVSQLDSFSSSVTSQQLNNHSNVTITNLADGQYLKYINGVWVNGEINLNASNDNLGDHTATQNLNMGGNKITNLSDPLLPNDMLTLKYLEDTVTNSPIHNQSLDSHPDVAYNITLQDGAILFFNLGQNLWNIGTADFFKDNLGNHTATQNLNMVGFNIINVKSSQNVPDNLINKSEFDIHTHTWNQINKTGSTLNDIDDVTISNIQNLQGLTYKDGANASNNDLFSLSSTEPTSTYNGMRWMPQGAINNLGTYNNNLLVCYKSGVPAGGLNNTWVDGKGNIVNV